MDVRFDAGFANGEIMDALTDDDIEFVGRIRKNQTLEALAAPHLVRPVGRPPCDGYEYVVDLGAYKADSWKHWQRIVLCVVDKPDSKTGQLELLPRYFFLVTSWSHERFSPEDLLFHYRRRGTFEDRIGELVETVRPRLSSPSFADNEVNLTLSVLAFNLVNIVRGEMESVTPSGWGLRRVKDTVLKAGARIVKSAGRLRVDLASAAAVLWAKLDRRLAQWRDMPRTERDDTRRRRRWRSLPKHAHTSLVLRA